MAIAGERGCRRGTDAFEKVREQFERDVRSMPVYIPVADIKGNRAVGVNGELPAGKMFYDNGTLNLLFVAYMSGYGLGEAMWRE